MTSPGTQQNPGLLPDRTCLMPAALCAQSITTSRPSPRIEGVREGTQQQGTHMEYGSLRPPLGEG